MTQAFGLSHTLGRIMINERPRALQLATVYDGYLGLWLKRWTKLPFVIYAHGNEILDAVRTDWPKPKAALLGADNIIAVSRFTAKLVEQAGVNPDRISIVHPGCDLHRFQPRPANLELKQKLIGSREKRVIVTVGGLVARKGHDMVLRALSRLIQKFPDITYLIVGDGPYRSELVSLVNELGLQQNVVFAGKMDDELLPEIYALSDVFVMPSRQNLDACDVEGFGLVYLEASACGKPVVAGRSGGTPDAVVDEETGFLVDPNNPLELANALERLLTDKDLAQTLGTRGRSRLIDNFEWPQIANRVQEIIENVVRNGNERPAACAAVAG
jgi:phosphatidyl-myo-inositol dimannoside synthase